MIADLGTNLSLYRGLAENLDQTIDYIANTDLTGIPEGRHVIYEERLLASVTKYVTGDPLDIPFEAHRRYMDLQYLVEGEESIFWMPMTTALTTEPRLADTYSVEKDVVLFHREGGTRIHLTPGVFCIFFPMDAHKPKCCVQKPATVRKVVFKILAGDSVTERKAMW